MHNLYALIMAGGGGTRLWPMSRKNKPKQMLSLVNKHTMFQVSFERLNPLIPPERVFVVSGQDQVEQLQADAPQIPAQNFIVEPFGQNTGPAVGLALMHIQHIAPDAVIAVLTADHHIANHDKFRHVIAAAAKQAEQGYIVTLGISPTFPSTGYGYIKRGDTLAKIDDFQSYVASGFTEKPNLGTATEFLLSGMYSWNSGMFISKLDYLLSEYKRQQTTMITLLDTIAQAISTPQYDAVLAEAWPQMPRLSIDYAVMERAERMAVIPVDMGWSDIGSWASLYDILEGDQNHNVLRGNAQHITVDTANTLIISDRLVATIGVEDLVIVDNGNALLVCPRERSQDVRTVVDQLKQTGDDRYL